jgi:hypothetical protein
MAMTHRSMESAPAGAAKSANPQKRVRSRMIMPSFAFMENSSFEGKDERFAPVKYASHFTGLA